MTTASLEALAGQTIADKYKLLSLIGSGGMGYVYQAEQIGLGRSVAIKVLRSERIATGLKWFRAEAMAASRINHPHAVAIYDFGVSDSGVPFLVMEHLRGRRLSSVIEHEPLAPERIVTIGAQILSALAEAHACGVVHCDLTSDNVIVERLREGNDFAKVIDFGLARVFDSPRGQGIIGTPEYMAPEQIRGQDVGPPADMYSVGALLYEMIVGRTPFAGANPQSIINSHLREQPTPPKSIIPTCPDALSDLVMWALEKPADARPESAQTMREALLTVLGQASTAPCCSVCGERSTLGQRFCAACGAKLQSERPASDRHSLAKLPRRVAIGTTQIDGVSPKRRTTRLTCDLSRISTDFVGREVELDRLMHFCSGAEAACTLSLIGPPGIGKARLVTETKQRLEGRVPMFFAAADPSGLRIPWYPVLSLLESVLELQGPVSLETLSRAVARCGLPARDTPGLAEIFAIEGPSQHLELAVRRREAHASALRALLSIHRRLPRAVFCFADVDEYDHPSQHLVAALTDAVTRTSLRMIVTASSPTKLPCEAEITLSGLPPRSTRELAAALVDSTELPSALSLHTVTSGSPAAVKQLAGWMLMGNSSAAAPSLLVDLVSLRVNRLPSAARRVLQAVAIHGTVAPRWLVEATLEEPELVAMTEPSWTGLVVLEEEMITIPSGLVANVIAASTPADVRRTLHRRALAALKGQANFGILGHHAEHAGELDAAYTYLLQAGDDAVRRFDDYGAASWYGRALSISRLQQSRSRPNDTERVVDAAIKLAEVLRCTDQLGLASGVLDEAEGFEPSPVNRARMERIRGRIALASGDTSAGVGHLRLGIGLAMRTGNREYLCDAYIDLARAVDRVGQTGAAIDELKQAIDVITMGEGMPSTSSPHNLWRVGLHLAERYLRTRQFERAKIIGKAALQQATRINSSRGRGRLSALLAHIYDSLGQPDSALRYRSVAIEELRQLGDRRSTAELLIDNAQSAQSQPGGLMPDHQRGMRMAAKLAAEVGWDEGVDISNAKTEA